ncbi:DUF87 domain-containing protein [Bradyrhizobium guangzhouense]|uniref:DUF87 domain-containing protein n=1 Tax=Bradyrhizobium guangzhouense TaxID=1325095 RepID=A0ABY0E594_9BRAD|nr:DUF87 domain-containing protein [Bradyrhizobium guangzhouense]RXH12330.1 DUF87 domain-containing protein [Bradyrhizobium guangzhouense]
MNSVTQRAKQLLEGRRKILEERYPRLRRPEPPVRAAPQPARVGTSVILGSDEQNLPVRLDTRSRLEHMHIIGTTGGGKTTLIEHIARQDILNGHGVCVVDPHGCHPESLYRHMLAWLYESGVANERVVHIIDPNSDQYASGFNPLAVPEGHDPAVVAEAALECFQRLWSDENPDSKPTIQRVLAGAFTALAELGLTLAETRLLFDPEDADGVREHVLCEVTDEYAKEELQWLQSIGKERTGIRDLRVEVTGPRNRIAKLIRLEALRTIVGQTERVIDLREAMDEGHIILANLSGGTRAYEKGADILGRLLNRSLLFHAKRRNNPGRPFFVYLDECQRYLSGDVSTALAEVRKQGVGLVLAHQWQSQLSAFDEEILSAVRSGTNIKVVFRAKDQREAMDLAEMVVPLNLEMPVELLTKETVVGYEVRRMRNASTGGSATTTLSDATTKTKGTGSTVTEGGGVAQSRTETVSEQESLAHTQGTTRSTTIGLQHSFGQTRGRITTQGESSAETDTTTDTQSTSHGRTTTESLSNAETDTRGRNSSRGRGGGRTEQAATSRGSSFGQSFDVAVDPWRTGETAYRRAAGFPGEASARSVQRGYDEGFSQSSGRSENWSETEGSSDAHAIQRSTTSGTAEAFGDGESHAEGHAIQRGRSSSVANSSGESETVGASLNVAEGETQSTTRGITQGFSIAEGTTTSKSWSQAHAVQESDGVTKGSSVAKGDNWSAGWGETLAPVMAMRPGAVHSKDNVLTMAANKLRSLTTGTAFINYVDHTGMNAALLQVPYREMPTLSAEEFARVVDAVCAKSPSALPVDEAQERAQRRKQVLIQAARMRRLPPPEPASAAEFRVPAKRQTRSKRSTTKGASND